MNHPLEFWKGGFVSPFRDNQFHRIVDRWFDDWSGARTFLRGESSNEGASFKPISEVVENKNSYVVKFDLPGINREQIKVDLHDGCLTVSGERREEKKEDGRKQHFSEIFY